MRGLTEAVEDVVKVVEIIVTFFYHGLVAHGVVEPAVGICHGAGTGQGGKEGRKRVARLSASSRPTPSLVLYCGRDKALLMGLPRLGLEVSKPRIGGILHPVLPHGEQRSKHLG